MLYSIGIFMLDTKRELLLVKATQEMVSNHSRTIQLLGILAAAYPKVVSKNELIQKLWLDEEVSDWALSRQIYQIRQLLSAQDPQTSYIKTVHTQGFKLDVEPVVDDGEPVVENSGQTIQEVQSEQNDIRKNKINRVIVASTGLLVLIAVLAYYGLKAPSQVYGEIYPAKTINLPLSLDWSSSKADSFQMINGELNVSPMGPEPLYVATALHGARFYQGAILKMHMQLTQEFVDNRGMLRFYFQTTRDGWPGEWDCMVETIETLDHEYVCQIDENGTFTKVLENEHVNLGVKLHQAQPVGGVTIKSATIEFPAGISTDTGWNTTDGLTREYERGVSFNPKTLAAKLITYIKGPLDLKGTSVAFTVEVEDSYKNPDTGLQFFLVDKNGGWQDCYIEGEDITTNVFTKKCQFNKTPNPFMLKQDETLSLGVSSFGKHIQGKIKIIGITITE
jgi:DNA-binding winged helix-turn-helix (wHTH) protein